MGSQRAGTGAAGLPARPPGVVVELLRLCVVVFCAALGFQIAAATGGIPLGGAWLGAALGSASGYVLGGVLGRTTISAVVRTEHALRDTSAEHIVAGTLGAVLGVLVGASVTWPVFLVDAPTTTFPIFGFVVVTVGVLGYRLGAGRRDAVLALFGPRVGLTPGPIPMTVLPRVLDTSVAVDGRVLDVVRAGFMHGRVLVPNVLLGELQTLADAADDLRRARGRRGLEVLEALRREPGVDLEVVDHAAPGTGAGSETVDAALVRICLALGAALLTLDTNLAKVAALAGVRVMNLHALALALRPPVSAGDEVSVLLLKPGKEAGQAVGYLDDGTMVVVERARASIGSEAHVQVTSVLTTANGRLVFARPVLDPASRR